MSRVYNTRAPSTAQDSAISLPHGISSVPLKSSIVLQLHSHLSPSQISWILKASGMLGGSQATSDNLSLCAENVVDVTLRNSCHARDQKAGCASRSGYVIDVSPRSLLPVTFNSSAVYFDVLVIAGSLCESLELHNTSRR